MCLPTIRNIYMYKRVLKTGKANVVRKPVGSCSGDGLATTHGILTTVKFLHVP